MSKSTAVLSTRAQSFSDNLTQLTTAVASVSSTVGRVLDDGKISASEYFDLVLASPAVLTIIKVGKQAGIDWLVLPEEERQAVMAEFSAKFDLPNDQVEAKIETTLTQAAVIYGGLEKAVKAVKKVYATWQPEKKA